MPVASANNMDGIYKIDFFLKRPDPLSWRKFKLHAYVYALSGAILEGNILQKKGQIWRSKQFVGNFAGSLRPGLCLDKRCPESPIYASTSGVVVVFPVPRLLELNKNDSLSGLLHVSNFEPSLLDAKDYSIGFFRVIATCLVVTSLGSIKNQK